MLWLEGAEMVVTKQATVWAERMEWILRKVRRVSREGNASADTFSAGQIGENRFCMFEQKPEVSKLLPVLGVTTEEQEELH